MRVTIFVGEKSVSIGGMQTHFNNVAGYFLKNHQLDYIIYRFPFMEVYSGEQQKEVPIKSLEAFWDAIKESAVFFFSDGWWIEEWGDLRKRFPQKLFVFRTGGNEFVKAPYEDNSYPLVARQSIWSQKINDCMDFVISNSRYTTNRLVHQGVNLNRILTIRGGIAFEECQLNHSRKPMLRKEIDAKFGTTGKKIFAIVSRFEPFKGIMEVLSVFSELNEYKDFFLLLVGDGSEKSRIETFCTEHINKKQFCILPATDNHEAMKYIAAADYYMNCSRYQIKKSGCEYYIHTETMGRSLFEAIYQFVPVIATDVGGTAELFDEFEKVGILIRDTKQDKKSVIKDILDGGKNCLSYGQRYSEYGWNYITEKLYDTLFEVRKGSLRKRVALCLDIDGTIYHNSFSEQDNIKNLELILSMTEFSEIIINSAANYDEILQRYPIFEHYLDRIIIISNCGKHLYMYGIEDTFWKNYTESIPGIQAHIVGWVQDQLIQNGMLVDSVKFVDKLYINFKINGYIDGGVIDAINQNLENKQYMLVFNNGNVKLISKIVNKAAPIRYLIALNGTVSYWIGAGNNVLDVAFMCLCDRSYSVNYESQAFEMVCVNNDEDMKRLINNIKVDIGGYLKNGAP